MIEFRGYLTGNALKHHQKRMRELGQKILIITFLLFIPVIVVLASALKLWSLLAIYPVLCLFFLLITFIPKGKKELLRVIPSRIFIEDECIVRIAGGKEDFKLIADADRMIDHGEFYEVIFPVGNASPDFICQKTLLTQGTLNEFEALFEGKIVRN